MKRPIRIVVRILFLAVVYVIFAGAISPWTQLPTLGDINFTLVFLLFSILHCAASSGGTRTALLFLLAASVSYILEEVGVRTGWIYGHYHYGQMLGPKLGDVPVLIPLAWFMMIYPSWIVARELLRGLQARSLFGIAAYAVVAALVMTGWDTIMDPGMSAAGDWVWEQGGVYFGVPLQNYFGWLLTTFVIYLGAGAIWRNHRNIARDDRVFPALPAIVYLVYGLSYMTPRPMPALQIVALFAMVLPGLVALIRFSSYRWLADA